MQFNMIGSMLGVNIMLHYQKVSVFNVPIVLSCQCPGCWVVLPQYTTNYTHKYRSFLSVKDLKLRLTMSQTLPINLFRKIVLIIKTPFQIP